ncbi:glycosyltransferase [Zhouia amylolytica]|uniref:Glycosyltransferase 2-like domain-containing protein n=1 Tax=Zhouia amylolytica AD3 TaxID=1286632 RepID=W2URR2_9FLAO|nr:glycosyltransferase [Zhouia amylolytica]ETN96840.1 hypothetical protein P278_02660 [Zhouia amylolytica AD3]MCQ0111187.1 glycosyltransferase [Zhouia amylolytica]
MPAPLLYAFVAVIAIQIFYLLFFFRRFAFHKETAAKKESVPAISIIIFIKNQAEDLKENLPYILSQNYPEFELVLINYDSYDDSLDIMESFADKYPQIKIVNVKNNEAFWGKKKYALTLGIKAAKYNHLVFTEINCKPDSDHWLLEIASKFDSEKTIILGYSAFKKIKKSLLNAFIRFENLVATTHRFSYLLSGIPVSGNGKNLAYHKDEFFNNSGFINHIDISNGEDQLFINQAATSKNTSLIYSKDSFTESISTDSFETWIDHKKSEYALIKKYKSKHRALINIYYTSQLLFIPLAILLIILQYKIPVVIGLILLRWIIVYSIYIPIAKKLEETSLLWALPFYEILLIFFQFLIFISNIISKPTNWR